MAIRVRTNSTEYTKHDGGAHVTLGTDDPALPPDLIIALVTADGRDVVRTHATPAADTMTVVVPFRGTATDDHPATLAPTDDHGVTWVSFGVYHIQVRDPDGAVLATSRPFPLLPIRTAQFVHDYLFGIPLYADAVLAPIAQSTIPGTRVAYVDSGMLKGPGELAYHATTQTFTWRDGPPAHVASITDLHTVPVLTAHGDSYLELAVDPYDLPAHDDTSMLLIDNLRLDSDALQRALWRAYDAIQHAIQVQLDTTVVSSDPTYQGHVDHRTDALTAERGMHRTIALTSAKARPLRRVLALSGWYNDHQALTIPDSWISVHESAAMIDVLAVRDSAMVTSSVLGATGGIGAAGMGQRFTAQFWRYTVVSGLRELSEPLIDALCKQAALYLLVELSQAATGGRSSRSASRDGVSEQWNYNPAGAYAEKIQAYTAWLEAHLPKLRHRYAGLNMVTL